MTDRCCEWNVIRFLQGDWDNCWVDHSHSTIIFRRGNTLFAWEPIGILEALLEDSRLPDVIDSVAVSLDQKFVAVQSGLTYLFVFNRETRKMWVLILAHKSVQIAPTIWSDHQGNSQDLVIPTNEGLELYKVSCARGECKLSRSISEKVDKYIYYPPDRTVVTLRAIKGGVRVTIFFLRFDAGDNLKLELPPPDRYPSFELLKAQIDDFSIVNLYDATYLALHSRGHITDSIRLFLLDKSQIYETHELAIPCTNGFTLTVSDNLLFCHSHGPEETTVFDLELCFSLSARYQPSVQQPKFSSSLSLPAITNLFIIVGWNLFLDFI